MNTFFSIGCATCKSLQLGGDVGGTMEFIPVFRNRELAELTMSDGWQSDEDAAAHPPVILEIIVQIK